MFICVKQTDMIYAVTYGGVALAFGCIICITQLYDLTCIKAFIIPIKSYCFAMQSGQSNASAHFHTVLMLIRQPHASAAQPYATA